MSLDQNLWKKALIESYQAIEKLTGVFLVTQGKGRKPNIMTIGWMQGGIIWGRPIISVLVRPSRFSFIHIEENPSFTICVPNEKMKREIDLCGSVSGETIDKFKSTDFTPIYSENFSVPTIKECPIHFECNIVQKTKVVEANFIPEIIHEYYSSGDFHSVYYGEIIKVKI